MWVFGHVYICRPKELFRYNHHQPETSGGSSTNRVGPSQTRLNADFGVRDRRIGVWPNIAFLSAKTLYNQRFSEEPMGHDPRGVKFVLTAPDTESTEQAFSPWKQMVYASAPARFVPRAFYKHKFEQPRYAGRHAPR